MDGVGPFRFEFLLRSAAAVFLAAVLAPAAASAAPLEYMTGHGPRAYPVVSLTWGLLAISIAVIVIIGVLLLWGALRRRAEPTEVAPFERLESGGRRGIRFITVGVTLTALTLVASVLWTLVTLADVASPPSKPAFTIEVTAHQWWWQVHYIGPNPSRGFTTANEIHIPVGKPVEVRLIGSDVIHSFWVPALTGKTDVIPGQVNHSWLEAAKAGVYRGQCTEYCGQQHAHMAFLVVAQPPAAFAQWWDHQLANAAPPATTAAAEDEARFIARCGACHTVRGTRAQGIVGPDLSHLMARRTIAAGTLPNTLGHLSGWIADPQGIKPGARMPVLDLSGGELTEIRRFLATLN